MRRLAAALTLLVAAAALALFYMYSVALRDPIVRKASIALPDWPPDALPIHVALLTDIHVSGPDMPPKRLDRIVEQVNSLHPDLVLLGGDFVSDKKAATKRYTGTEALAPLSGLKARFGAVAVLGNHDHWRSTTEIINGLRAAHVRTLQNNAVEVGPISLGGVDDAFTGHDNVAKTVGAMRVYPGARVLLSHSPDVTPAVPSDVTLILAGHTHCGQIRVPWIGAVSYMSKYGERFACGLATDGSKRVVTSGGLGTSVLPLRLGAVPEIWLVTLGPERQR